MSELLTLFDRFGGTRKMAEALGEPVSTVQSWKTAGRIPAGKQPEVLAKARELQLGVCAEDIIFPLGRRDDSGCGETSATKAPGIISATGCEAAQADEIATLSDRSARADKLSANICEPRGSDSHGPFSDSPSICSTTREPSASCTNPACSTGEAEAA